MKWGQLALAKFTKPSNTFFWRLWLRPIYLTKKYTQNLAPPLHISLCLCLCCALTVLSQMEWHGASDKPIWKGLSHKKCQGHLINPSDWGWDCAWSVRPLRDQRCHLARFIPCHIWTTLSSTQTTAHLKLKPLQLTTLTPHGTINTEYCPWNNFLCTLYTTVCTLRH